MARLVAMIFFFCASLACCGARTGLVVVDDDEGVDAGSRPRCEHPVTETCNGLDDDCDGEVDEGLALTRLGEPIVLRSPGETTTGECRPCDQVLRAEVLPIDGGLVVLWQMNFWEISPRLNTFARRTDRDGVPVEPAWLWSDVFSTLTFEAAALPGARPVLAFCERRDDRFDYPAALLVDERGRAGEIVRLGAGGERCVLGRALGSFHVGWTGQRVLFARNDGSDARLEVAGTDARPIATTVLGTVNVGSVQLATSSHGALVAHLPRDGPVDRGWFADVFDALGSRSAPRITLPEGEWLVLPNAEGWWLFGGGEGSWLRLRVDGTVAEPARPLGGVGTHPLRGLGLPGGGAVLVTRWTDHSAPLVSDWIDLTELAVLDAEGITRSWTSRDLGESEWRAPTLRWLGGRVAIVYTLDRDPSVSGRPALHNELRLRMLSCER